MAAPDVAQIFAFISPVAKGLFAKSGKATVMEILKVFVRITNFQFIANVAETLQSAYMMFGTRDALSNNLEPAIFAGFDKYRHGAFTAGGTYSQIDEATVECWDCTDGAGHGFLMASDYFYVNVDTNGMTPALGDFYFKILYRFKNVSMQEYVGIVQSQQ